MLEQDWSNLTQVVLDFHSLVVKKMLEKIQLVDYKKRVCCSWMRNLKQLKLLQFEVDKVLPSKFSNAALSKSGPNIDNIGMVNAVKP